MFPIEPIFPEGFSYFPGFINELEEEDLCTAIAGIELHQFHFQGYEAKRKVASFGYDYSFEKGSLIKGKDIPPVFSSLVEKLSAALSIAPENLAELLVTEYPVGSVINWHRDAPPFDLIAGVSLLADCTFRLRPYDKAKQNRQSIISHTVERRSMYVMKGPARTDWQHSIAPVKNLRYSITVRTLKAG